jgi:hypothetical protein
MRKLFFNSLVFLLFLSTIALSCCTNSKSSKNVAQTTTALNSEDSLYCNISSADKAVKIAEKELLKTYGESIYKDKPFIAKLEDNQIWLISGTLKMSKDRKTNLITTTGGVPYIRISAKNCKVLQIGHTK